MAAGDKETAPASGDLRGGPGAVLWAWCQVGGLGTSPQLRQLTLVPAANCAVNVQKCTEPNGQPPGKATLIAFRGALRGRRDCLFEAAYRMGLEGLVSKHRERRYRPRTCDWVKVKNRKHPAFSRVLDA